MKRKCDKIPSRDEKENDDVKLSIVKQRRHLPPRAKTRISKSQRDIHDDSDDADMEDGTSDTEYSDSRYSDDDDDDHYIMINIDGDETIVSDDKITEDTAADNNKATLNDNYDSDYNSDTNSADKNYIENIINNRYDAEQKEIEALI